MRPRVRVIWVVERDAVDDAHAVGVVIHAHPLGQDARTPQLQALVLGRSATGAPGGRRYVLPRHTPHRPTPCGLARPRLKSGAHGADSDRGEHSSTPCLKLCALKAKSWPLHCAHRSTWLYASRNSTDCVSASSFCSGSISCDAPQRTCDVSLPRSDATPVRFAAAVGGCPPLDRNRTAPTRPPHEQRQRHAGSGQRGLVG